MRFKSENTRSNKSVIDVVVMCFLVTIVLVTGLALWGQNRTYANTQPEAVSRTQVPLPPLPGEANLLFSSAESADLFAPAIEKSWKAEQASQAIRPAQEDKLIGLGNESVSEAPESEGGHDNIRAFGQSFLSPDRRYVALNAHMGPMTVVWTIDLKDRSNPSMVRLTGEGFGRFLGWHPDSRHALYLAYDLMVSDPGLWLVDVADGSHRRIDVPNLLTPQNLTAAAMSPDGTTIVYATTQGMGTGSEIWKIENEKEHQRIWGDDLTVIGHMSYSPDGQSIAFANLLDSPVPFANAGLWKMDTRTDEATFLTTMDGGHGQLPLWSPDSTELYFIKRDNANDTKADYESVALVRRFQENKYPEVPGTSRTSLPELQNTDSLGQKVPGTFAVYFII